MTSEDLKLSLQQLVHEDIPLPAKGKTPERLQRLVSIGKENLSLAKLAEAHWDAVAILAEAGREPEPGAIYAVWASEMPNEVLRLSKGDGGYQLNGRKPFCSGIGIVDRALITVSEPHASLFDVDMRSQEDRVDSDLSRWATTAFLATKTGAITFNDFRSTMHDIVGPENFYLSRPGFWHGACGPAACWVGGATGLVSFARESNRSDPHTLAHLGAMEATLWMMNAALDRAGRQIDGSDTDDPMLRALRLRHVIEQGCSDILRRLPRAYGPYPLAMNAEISCRYQELDMYLRQSHGERDLETIGRVTRAKEVFV
jgi:hypothetical protein